MEDNKEGKKPTYGELEEMVNNLYTKNQQLGNRLREITNILNLLPYYIDVVKNSDKFSIEFVGKCEAQLRDIMLPPEEESNDNKGE